MGLWQNIRTESDTESKGKSLRGLADGKEEILSGSDQGAQKMGESNQMANIGKSISIKGDVIGEEDTVIEGHVEGRIELKNHHLTIGPNGEVHGEISAKQVTIVGRVAGNVVAAERLELRDTGKVEGDLHTPRLLVQEGARINGKITMGAVSGSSSIEPEVEIKAS